MQQLFTKFDNCDILNIAKGGDVMAKKPFLIRFDDEVHYALKVFAVKNKLKLNDAIKLLLENYKQQKGEQ